MCSMKTFVAGNLEATRQFDLVSGGWGRDRTVDLTIFSRALVPTELPSQTTRKLATQTGLEPATSAVTGRRANQLRYWAK
jgi:integrase